MLRHHGVSVWIAARPADTGPPACGERRDGALTSSCGKLRLYGAVQKAGLPNRYPRKRGFCDTQDRNQQTRIKKVQLGSLYQSLEPIAEPSF
jgi:hypothetical protein